MRLLLVTHRYPPDGIAGVERVTEDLAGGLVKRGHTVTVMARRRSMRVRIKRESEITPAGVRVERLTGVVGSLHRPSRRALGFGGSFQQAFNESNPDVVHVMHPHGFHADWIEMILRRRTPLVVSLHDFFFACPLAHLEKRDGRSCAGPNGGIECANTCFAHEGRRGAVKWPLRAAFFRQALSLASVVVAPSEYVASYFTSNGLAADIEIVPNGIRLPPALAPVPVRSRETRSDFRLAYIGVVAPHKGVHLILEAIATSDGVAESLLVAGEQPSRTYMRQLGRLARKIPNLAVGFRGRYDPSELSTLLSDVDLVIVPSRVPESFSMTAREALARGVPVIVARIGALPAAIDDGVTGWTFAPNSASSLAALLNRLASNRGELTRARNAARNRRVYSVDDHTEAMLGLYEAAAERHLRVATVDATEAAALGRALNNVGPWG